ncbi:hypothetical protein N7466_001212 [Penicillium verhagenii]|uniref:uncharacterized protein n=1 Tax=Penicillium verhagenii TaxID=1562060 RepID=UPI002544D742|nr:uncharacterized protein N7466_001212 [Penicillium verhagenii]KAJ5948197.1 hypothetical protein N7466_001212 [Penicillium verhagenii]
MSITSDAGTTTAPLPLTTTFTPPSACLSDLWFVQSSNGYTASNTYTSGVCPRGWVMASNLTTEVSNQMQTVGTCCPQYLYV